MSDTLGRDDFDAFFASVYGEGVRPFVWQRRLLNDVLDGAWPDALVAPTGSGKTSVIDVHVFALAVAQATGSPLPRRRLAMIVNRRVLVDDQYQHARELARRLENPDGVLKAVADALWQVQGRTGAAEDADAFASPLLVARLRGGEPPSRRWADHPAAAAILCATPDMWGSRLLFRGYGSSSRAWPREAGLLAFDTVAVIDEAHLSRQLVCTARRVGQLATVADQPWSGPAPLHVVEATATRDQVTDRATGRFRGVEDKDLTDSQTLSNRLRKPKPVTLVPCKNWPAPAAQDRTTRELTERTVELATSVEGTVGCFVNTVARAIAVAEALRRARTERPLSVVMICGQVRPIDVERLNQRYPGLLKPDRKDDVKVNKHVDVIVSTQSLEVGVDIDLAGIVTELASGSALAQRAGRVNRRGIRAEGPVVVVGPDGDLRADAHSGPYRRDELTAAYSWVAKRATEHDGLAPWALLDDPAPQATTRRVWFQRPELGQAWHWAQTSDDLAADPELDLWLSDDLEPDTSVGIVVRRDLPTGDDGIDLIKRLPPRRHEVFPVPLTMACRALTAVRFDGPGGKARAFTAVVVHGDEFRALEWSADGRLPRIRPGDIIVVDQTTRMFTRTETNGHITPPVVVADENVLTYPADDVLETIAEIGDLQPGEIVHRIDLAGRPNLVDLVAALDLDELAPDDATLPADKRQTQIEQGERDVVAVWLDDHADSRMARAAAELLRDEPTNVDVVVQRDEDDVAVRVLVIDERRAVADEYVRQERTTNKNSVPLGTHQHAVGNRAADLGQRLGLPAQLVETLRHAGEHHDDGKADSRFQIRLGAQPGAQHEPLAKSRTVTPETVRRRRDASGLPPGWRHEQRSVVEAWHAIPATLDRELVARLIGTTHGHGRTGFPHVATELLTDTDDERLWALAARLFDEGRWDDLIERTHLRYGVWACAYLEAVLRAADGRVSAEGS